MSLAAILATVNAVVDQVRVPTMTIFILLIVPLVAAWAFKTVIWRPLTSPLRELPHPPGGRGLVGHAAQIMDLHTSIVNDWIDTLGPTFRINGPFGLNHRLFTLDPRALNHVLSQTDTYTKSPMLRDLVRRYMKEGLIVAEGERHRIQRKVAQRLFSRNGLKSMGAVVQEKANQLRDIISDLCTNPELSTPYATDSSCGLKDGARELDIYSASTRSTYDIIGEITTDTPFDSLGDWGSEIGGFYERFERMQMPSGGMRMLVGLLVPSVEKLWPSRSYKAIVAAMGPLEGLAQRMMVERQREIDEGKREAIADNRDLLTLMLRSNMAKGMTSDQKLRDEEITGQLATFMFAGSDTTAGTIAFGMYQLAQHREMQERLRAEVLSYGDNLPYEQMDDLPFLDAVVKEILRINPSLPGTVRQAARDDMIPLAEPVKLTDGRLVSELKIRKGQIVHIPIEHLHTSTSIWGESAAEFDPSRFLSMPLGQSTASPTTPQTATFPSSTWAGFSFSPLTPPLSTSSSTSASASASGYSVSPLTPTFEEGIEWNSSPSSPATALHTRKTYDRRSSAFSDLGGKPSLPLQGDFAPSFAPRRGSAPLLDQQRRSSGPPAAGATATEASRLSFISTRRRSSQSTFGNPSDNVNVNAPGVWPNFMTFIDGPRRCVGYKLAIMKIKIMIFTLIREFEVEVCQDKVIRRWNMLSTRPYEQGTLASKGSSLTLIFKPYQRNYEQGS
ncbi:hypothetical protein IAU59_006139 [Kwoniella sp. CBS 9459]